LTSLLGAPIGEGVRRIDCGREKSRPAMVGERNGMGKERGWACQESYDSVITLANDSSVSSRQRSGGLEKGECHNFTSHDKDACVCWLHSN